MQTKEKIREPQEVANLTLFETAKFTLILFWNRAPHPRYIDSIVLVDLILLDIVVTSPDKHMPHTLSSIKWQHDELMSTPSSENIKPK